MNVPIEDLCIFFLFLLCRSFSSSKSSIRFDLHGISYPSAFFSKNSNWKMVSCLLFYRIALGCLPKCDNSISECCRCVWIMRLTKTKTTTTTTNHSKRRYITPSDCWVDFRTISIMLADFDRLYVSGGCDNSQFPLTSTAGRNQRVCDWKLDEKNARWKSNLSKATIRRKTPLRVCLIESIRRALVSVGGMGGCGWLYSFRKWNNKFNLFIQFNYFNSFREEFSTENWLECDGETSNMLSW